MADYDLNQYDPLFQAAAQKYNVDARLLKAIASVENGLDAKGQPKTSSAGAVGIMQFMPDTATEFKVDPTNVRSSIDGGARYLSKLLTQYGNPDAALDHYSGHSTGYGKAILDAYNTVSSPAPPPQLGQTVSEQEANLPPQRNLKPGAANAPDSFTLEKGQQGQPGTNVRTTENTPSAPGVPLAASTSSAPSGELPPGLKEIIEPTQAPTAAQTAPASKDGLPPGLKEIIEPTAKPTEQPTPTPTPTLAPASVPPTASPPPPIYTAPAVPLIGKEQLPQNVPAPTGVDMPAVTSENKAAFAGFSHGARQAINPLLEFGSNVGNTIADWTGLPIRTDRVANDVASEAAFNAQYGNNQLAQGPALAARTAVPLAMGLGTGALLRGGLALAGAPAAGEFLAGTGGSSALSRLASSTTGGGIQGLVAGGPYGALVGGGLGATVLPAAGAVANFLAGRTATGAGTQALQAIYRAAARDGMTPAQLDARIAALGPEATLADVGGANLRSLAEGTANTPGSGMNVAMDFLRGRSEGQAERLDQAVRTATGATGSAFDNLDALQRVRAEAAAPRYEASFNRIRTTQAEADNVAPFIDDPIGQQALQRGLRIIQLEKLAAEQPFNPADYGVSQNPDGSFTLGSGVTNLRLMDAVKRGYDNIVEGYRDALTGRLNLDQYGRAVNAARATYVGKLRDMFPRYGNALDAWGGPSADMDAITMGRRVLSTDADQTTANVARLTPSQRQMYQVGVAQSLRDRIESTPDAADATRRIFGNTQIRNRIAAGFGGEDTDAFRNFQATMEREAIYADTHRQLVSGSPTARRQAAMMGAANPTFTPGDIAEAGLHLTTGGVIPAVMHLARRAINPLLSRPIMPSDPYSAALGNTLFNPAFRFGNVPPPGPSMRNLLVGPVGQQAGQLLLDSNRNQRPQSP